MGSHVVSGIAKAVVIHPGTDTEFGKISENLRQKKSKTDFEVEIRRFGTFLMEVTFVLVTLLFATNIFFHKPIMESFLFALALAVGLTPQLLPPIIATNLARGAKKMARKRGNRQKTRCH